MFTGIWSGPEPTLEKPEQWNGSKPRHANREVALLIGPRWDSEDFDGMGFVRIVAGLRRLSGRSVDGDAFTTSTPALGVGGGFGVGPFMLDMNLLMSTWEKRSAVRFGFSLGYTWATAFGGNREPASVQRAR
jgi:hypothetical protein